MAENIKKKMYKDKKTKGKRRNQEIDKTVKATKNIC